MLFRKKYLLLIILACFSKSVFAEPVLLTNDPKRPVNDISRDLGIEPQEFVDCFKDVKPAQGSRPTTARVHANKAILLKCLQTANPNITNEMLDTVMDRYRPGGHKAQMPQ
jgi:hypothetical protein